MKRICNNPAPMLNGSNCSGDDTKLVSCGTDECSNKVALPIITKVGAHIAANAIAPGIGSLIVAGVDALMSAGE